MLLQNFMLNTDYDTLKEDSVIEKTLTISGTIYGNTSKTVEMDVPVNPGSYFIIPSFTIDEVPDATFNTAFSVYNHPRSISFPHYELSMSVVRKNATTYNFAVNYYLLETSSTQVTFSFTVHLKLHLLLASTDE